MLYIAVLKKPRHVFTCPEYPTMPWVKMKIRIPDVFFFFIGAVSSTALFREGFQTAHNQDNMGLPTWKITL